MSINQALVQALRIGKLVSFLHPLGWEGSSRAFLMTNRLVAQMDAARSSTDLQHQVRWEALRADIAHFVQNGRVDLNMMKWLEPRAHEHWEFRSIRPRPALRVFGRFAAPGVFVATHAVERAALKDKTHLNWELAKLTSEEEWTHALGDQAPFSAADYETYITGNASRTVRMDP